MPPHQPAVGCPGPAGPTHVAVAGERVQDEDGVVARGVELAPGLVGDAGPRAARRRARASKAPSDDELAVARPGRRRARRRSPAASPSSERASASVTGADGTVSSGVCQSIALHSPGSRAVLRTKPAIRCGPGLRAVGALRRSRCARRHCARGGEACLEVGLEVVDVLEADRQAHEARRDAGRELLLGRELRVRRRRGVDDEASARRRCWRGG